MRLRDATQDQHATGEVTTSSKLHPDTRALHATNYLTDTGLECCTSRFRSMFTSVHVLVAPVLSQPSVNPWTRFAVDSPEHGSGTWVSQNFNILRGIWSPKQ